MSKPNLVPVENKPGLFRDPVSGAIINTDSNGAIRAREIRKKKLEQEETIEDLREEVQELKLLLAQLLEKMEK